MLEIKNPNKKISINVNRLETLRKQKNIKVKEIVGFLGYKRRKSYYSRTSREVLFTYAEIVALAEMLDTTLTYLISDSIQVEKVNDTNR